MCLLVAALALPGLLDARIEPWLGLIGVVDRLPTFGAESDKRGMYIRDICN